MQRDVTSFWYLYCCFWTYFTPFFSVSIVDFEQVNNCLDSEIATSKTETEMLNEFPVGSLVP